MLIQSEGGNRSLFEQLDNFRIDEVKDSQVGLWSFTVSIKLQQLYNINDEHAVYTWSNGVFQDVENLMEWWNTVECKLQMSELLQLQQLNYCSIINWKHFLFFFTLTSSAWEDTPQDTSHMTEKEEAK